jgi:hypothetical protein
MMHCGAGSRRRAVFQASTEVDVEPGWSFERNECPWRRHRLDEIAQRR